MVLPLLLAIIRIGIIGTDTSHVPAFTSLLNDETNKNHVPGARVVAMFKGGSPDLPSSADRVEKYFEELRTKYKVEPVAAIADLCPKVDAILLESVDGRPHLQQAREAFACGVPVFIDKPLAATLADAREIARLAKEKGVPWFSSSSLRFSTKLAPLRIPEMNGAIAWSPGPTEPHHPLEMAWYGIHGVEILYALMGRGCEEVVTVSTPGADVATGRWNDGRIGVLRLTRPYGKYGATTFSPKEVAQGDGDLNTGYVDLVRAIVSFFETKKPPVDEADTLEMFAFMDAAQRSKESGGSPAKLLR